MDRQRWAPVVDRFLADLRSLDFLGRGPDVRENVGFRGGFFPTWIYRNFPESVCVLSAEWTKFFMDEWTGHPDEYQVKAIQQAIESTVSGTHQELAKLHSHTRDREITE